MDLLNSNDYKRGFEEGKSAAMNGKDKDYSGMGYSWKFWIHGNNALETYTQGYNEGYAFGMKMKSIQELQASKNEPVAQEENSNEDIQEPVKDYNVSNNSNNHETTSTTMAEDYNSYLAQQYERELRAIQNLHNTLTCNICNQINTMNGRMIGYKNKMVETGIAAEVCQKYNEVYYSRDAKNMSIIYNNITERDLPMIETYYNMINEQLYKVSGRTAPSLVNKLEPVRPITSDVKVNDDVNSNLLVQADATKDFMDFLVLIKEDMALKLRDYQEVIDNMAPSGVPVQICQHYVTNFVGDNVTNIKNFVRDLQMESYPFLMEVFRKTVYDMQTLNYSYDGTPRSM